MVLCFHQVHHGDDLADLDELPELRLFKFCNEIPNTNDEWNLHGAMKDMVPKHGRAKVPAEYQPLSTSLLEAGEPETQHGFRSEREIEEHLVAANLVIDKSWREHPDLDYQFGFTKSFLTVYISRCFGELYPNKAFLTR